MRIATTTLGCKANQGDTDALREGIVQALDGAVHLVDTAERADVVVVNTCTVTHTADADARQVIRRLRRVSPSARIVVTGCYAQTDRETLEAMPEVDVVVGNVHKATLPALVARLARGESGPAAARTGGREWSPTLRDAVAIRSLPAGRTRPFVKVQDGCNYVCSFCIIPSARGRSRSRSLDEVVDEVRAYEVAGAQEVVLTGIHLGHWGRDMTPRQPFGRLVRSLLDRTECVRLRISSLEPNEVDRDVLDLVANHPRVCGHLHVPLQSGCDRILARMRRVYRTAWYTEIIGRFRDALPRGAWGIDVMVGFPGETDADFQETVRYLEGLDFTYLHVFPYSPRHGTEAATLPDAVDPRTQRERTRVLAALSDARRAAHATAAVGEVGRVLVEVRRTGQRLRGFTEHYVPVTFDGPSAWVNRLVDVRITGANGPVARGVPA